MRTTIVIVAGVAGLLATALPAQAQFYGWGPYLYARPFHRYGFYRPYRSFYRSEAYAFYRPFYPPRYVYAPPPSFWYEPPPFAYRPPPVVYERPLTYRRPRVVRRSVQRAAAPVPPPKLPAPSHDLYPPESY